MSKDQAHPQAHAPKGPLRRRRAHHLTDSHLLTRCSARSKRTGQPCGQFVRLGHTVCKWHGGAAPQVKASAEARLRALEHPAISRLEWLIEQSDFPSVAYQAARDVLDRLRGRPTERIEHHLEAEEILIAGLIAGRGRAHARKAEEK